MRLFESLSNSADFTQGIDDDEEEDKESYQHDISSDCKKDTAKSHETHSFIMENVLRDYLSFQLMCYFYHISPTSVVIRKDARTKSPSKRKRRFLSILNQ